MKTSKNTLTKITEYTIYLYILITMLFDNPGDIAVKIIRVTTTFFLFISIISRLKIRKSSYCLYMMLFLIYNILTIFTSFSKEYAISYTSSLAYVIIIDILICQFIYKDNIIKPAVKVFIFGALLKNILVFGQNGLLTFLYSRSSEGTSANTIGFYSAIAFLMCIIMILNKKENLTKSNNRYLYIGLAVIFLIFTILSASRKAFVYILVPLVIYFIINGKNPLKLIVNTIIIMLIMLLVYTAVTKVDFLYDLVGNRVESMISGFKGEETDASTQTRMGLIDAGMEWFKEKPWTGYGMSNFMALNRYYRNSKYYAHNNYVELLVDCGIIGTVIYYYIYVKILMMAWKNKRNVISVNPIILGIILSLFIGEYGMVTYNDPVYQLVLLFLFMYLTKQEEERKMKINEK